MKYFIIALSALIIEICSTFYIRGVAEKNTLMMLLMAAIGPLLGLPFLGYMIETKSWGERIKQAMALSIGYVIGALIVIILIK
jgi:ABC-type transport system involved in multi-copper enzyme maturation permease subunit